MKKVTIILMLIAVFSKLLGFIREIVLSYTYGASSTADAYLISLTIPGTIFALIGAGITTTFIPIYNEIVTKENKLEANRFISNLINILFLLVTLLVLVILVFTPEIVKIFALGFSEEILELSINFTRVTILGMYFYGIIYILEGFLQSNKSFVTPAIMSLPYNLIIIASMIISTYYSQYILVIGTVLASLIQFLILFLYSKRIGYRFQLTINIKSIYIKKMLLLTVPVIIGLSVNQINNLVDKTLASTIIEGGISSLYYATRLNQFMQGVIVMSIATVMYPKISKMVSMNNMKGLQENLSTSISLINLLVIPASIIAMVLSQPIVTVLFGRGAFDLQAIELTSNALFYYSLGMLGVGLREIISRGFYAIKNTRTPMINSIIGVLINILLSIVLSKFMGIDGIALATSISAIVTTLLLLYSFNKTVGFSNIKKVIVSFAKITLISIITGIVARELYVILIEYINLYLTFIITIIVSLLVYLSLAVVVRLNEISMLFKVIYSKLTNRMSKD